MSDCVREMTLKELVEVGNYDIIQQRFDKQEDMRREYESRCQYMVQEQSERVRRQLEEKENTIQALLKCVNILGGN